MGRDQLYAVIKNPVELGPYLRGELVGQPHATLRKARSEASRIKVFAGTGPYRVIKVISSSVSKATGRPV